MDAMSKLLKAVIKMVWTIRQVDEDYSVSNSTLSNRLSGHVLPCAPSGPSQHLHNEEEKELAQFACCSVLTLWVLKLLTKFTSRGMTADNYAPTEMY